MHFTTRITKYHSLTEISLEIEVQRSNLNSNENISSISYTGYPNVSKTKPSIVVNIKKIGISSLPGIQTQNTKSKHENNTTPKLRSCYNKRNPTHK
jgi:hypothetical protein